jgi:hypothetical protein
MKLNTELNYLLHPSVVTIPATTALFRGAQPLLNDLFNAPDGIAPSISD